MDSTILLLATYLGPHAAFIWGRYRVFAVGSRTPAGVRLIELSAVASILVGFGLIVIRDGPRPGLDLFGTALGISSGALFAWGVITIGQGRLAAIFSADVPRELITTGPFRYVRHPFYVSYLLCHLQAVLLSRSIGALLPLFWMTGIYVHAARLEERKFLNGPLSMNYFRYSSRTGQFIPNVFHSRRCRHAD